MLATTQWPLERAVHLTSLVCVLWSMAAWKLNGPICAMCFKDSHYMFTILETPTKTFQNGGRDLARYHAILEVSNRLAILRRGMNLKSFFMEDKCHLTCIVNAMAAYDAKIGTYEYFSDCVSVLRYCDLCENTRELCDVLVSCSPMGLLPDTQNCGCACAGNAGNVSPVTAGKRSRHASRHVRDARAVMHAGIAN